MSCLSKILDLAPCLPDRKMNVVICYFLECFARFFCLDSFPKWISVLLTCSWSDGPLLFISDMLTGEESSHVLLRSENGCICSQVEQYSQIGALTGRIQWLLVHLLLIVQFISVLWGDDGKISALANFISLFAEWLFYLRYYYIVF